MDPENNYYLKIVSATLAFASWTQTYDNISLGKSSQSNSGIIITTVNITGEF